MLVGRARPVLLRSKISYNDPMVETLLLNERYRLDRELGQGGAGTIYQAQDVLLDRSVAIKVLGGKALGSQGRARLLREAKAAAQLNHPNIVSVYDAGEAGDQFYIVMELVEGQSLHEYIPSGLTEKLDIFRQLCLALEHAHAHQIVHRDLKPENVILTAEGVAKLTDFGLSRPVASRLTNEGEISGTVFYLAPEQALGQEVDVRTDIYSLGVMLYESVTGQLPFSGDDPLAVISQHLYAPLVPPRLRAANIPARLDALIVQMMAKAPLSRPANTGEVRQHLEALLQTGPIPTQEAPGPTLSLAQPALLERMARGQIIGREKELAEARQYWHTARSGERQLLLVSGEPGIGKSRLVRELVTLVEISGGQALVGECYPEGGAPYSPFAQIFRQVLHNPTFHRSNWPDYLLADLVSVSSDLQSIFPGLPPNPRLDPLAEQQRLFESVAAFVSQLCLARPCLLVVEDAHWADEASLALLRFLARRLRTERLMLVSTYREVELDESLPFQDVLLSLQRERLATRIKLGRLDRQATDKLLTALLGEPTPQEFLDRIYQETEGNPFYIEEVCKALVESGKLDFSGGSWSQARLDALEVPQSIRITIQARLSKLPVESQDVLRLAAILGREFDYELLAAACEQKEEALISALEQALQAQLIEDISGAKGGTFRFVHALIPMTLVDSLSGLRRRRLHRQAAEVIERLRPNDLEALAYQYSLAETQEKARYYLTQAGERAEARYANEDAIRQYSRALEFCESPSQECFELLAARVKVYDLVAQRELQHKDIQALQTIAEGLNDDRLRLRALIAWVDYHSNTDFTAARQPAQAALDLASKLGDPLYLAQAQYRLATTTWRDGDLRHGILYLDQAYDNFKLAGQTGEMISCLYLEALLYTNLGDHQQGQKLAEEAVQLSRQAKDRRKEGTSLRHLGIAYAHQDQHAKAFELYLEALEIHRQVGDRTEECNALNAIGGALVELGRLEEARSYFLKGLEIAQGIGNDFTVAMLLANYVYYVYIQTGDYQGGLAFLEQQIEQARECKDTSMNFIAARQLTEVLHDLGQYEQSLVYAEESLALAELRGEQRNRIDLLSWVGRLQALTGQVEAARRNLIQSRDLALASPEPDTFIDPYFNSAYIAWLFGSPEHWQAALAQLAGPTAQLRQLKLQVPLAFILDLQARLLLSMNQPAQALRYSSEAIELIKNNQETGSLGHFYYTHYRALRENGQIDAAFPFLQQAYDWLNTTTERLTDPGLKESWQVSVHYNQKIRADYSRQAGNSRR